MLNIAICDDCQNQTEKILTLLNKYQQERPCVDIFPRVFNSANELAESLEKNNQQYDMYLLDILMPELNGIELAKKLREKYKYASIIFLTSSRDYAFDAFRVSAAQYILKPITGAELFPVLDNVIAMLNKNIENFFILSTSERSVKISFSSIICMELVKRIVRVYIENGSTVDSKNIRVSFAEYIDTLLHDRRFLYPHSSFVLNMVHVNELTKNSFIMKNNIEIPVPRYKYTDAKNKYFDFLSECGIGRLGDKL